MVASAQAMDKLQSPIAAWLRKTGAGLVDLLCSPNAHTRSIVLLGSRCSSKRALGDPPALYLEAETN